MTMYKHCIRFFKEYLPGKGKGYFWGIVCLISTIVATTSVPLFVRDAINVLSSSAEGKGLDELQGSSLFYLALIILGLGVFLSICSVLSRYLLFLEGRKIEAEVRQNFFDAVVSMPIEKINEYQSGDLISRGTSDVSGVRIMVSMGILHSINSSLFLIFCLYNMLNISTRLTLLCLIPLPLIILSSRLLSKRMMIAGRENQNQLGVLAETVREQFRAHTLLSIFPVFSLINFLAALNAGESVVAPIFLSSSIKIFSNSSTISIFFFLLILVLI